MEQQERDDREQALQQLAHVLKRFFPSLLGCSLVTHTAEAEAASTWGCFVFGYANAEGETTKEAIAEETQIVLGQTPLVVQGEIENLRKHAQEYLS